MPTDKESEAVRMCARLQFVGTALSALLTLMAVSSHRSYPVEQSRQLGMLDSVTGHLSHK